MSLADGLSVVGAFLSALGVAITLWGTRTTRTAFARLRRVFLEPITGSANITLEDHTGSATGTVTITATVTGTDKLRPGDTQRMLDELDRRIDELGENLRGHSHDRTEASIEKLRAEDERIRADLEGKLAEFDAEGRKAERWNVAGLVIAFLGAVLAGLALFV